jgi:uncharacterized RDD family membrane protein YckC
MSSVQPDDSWWLASDGNWYPPNTAPGRATNLGQPPGFSAPTMPCSRCGYPQTADRVACETCGQVRMLPVGVVLTSPGRRLGQYLLEILLAFVTLFIGWIIWSLVVWGRGQTPAMQVLHIWVVKSKSDRPATWGTMFVREFLAKGLMMGLIAAVFFPAWIVLVFMLLWDKDRQELWDKVADTIVVSDGAELP